MTHPTKIALALTGLALGLAAIPASATVSISDGSFATPAANYPNGGSNIVDDGSTGAFSNDGWVGLDNGPINPRYPVGAHYAGTTSAGYINEGEIYQDIGTVTATGDIITVSGDYSAFVNESSEASTAGYEASLYNFANGAPTGNALATVQSVTATGTGGEDVFLAITPLTFSGTTAGEDLGVVLSNPVIGRGDGYATQTNFTGFLATETPAASPAPEPSQYGMMVLIGLGLGGLMLRARKARAVAA